MTVVSCLSQVLNRTRPQLKHLVHQLHALFFPQASGSQGRATGCLYRQDVTVEEFLNILASWYALTVSTALNKSLAYGSCTVSHTIESRTVVHKVHGLSALQRIVLEELQWRL